LAEAMADGRVSIEGDADALGRLVGLIARVDPDFEIIIP
jgi:ubiquinone biosynthesis protein UbiJ